MSIWPRQNNVFLVPSPEVRGASERPLRGCWTYFWSGGGLLGDFWSGASKPKMGRPRGGQIPIFGEPKLCTPRGRSKALAFYSFAGSRFHDQLII